MKFSIFFSHFIGYHLKLAYYGENTGTSDWIYGEFEENTEDVYRKILIIR